MFLFEHRVYNRGHYLGTARKAVGGFGELFDYIVSEIDNNESDGILYYYDLKVDDIFDKYILPLFSWKHKKREDFVENEDDKDKLSYAQRVYDDFRESFRETAFSNEDFFHQVYLLWKHSDKLGFPITKVKTKAEFYCEGTYPVTVSEVREGFFELYGDRAWYQDKKIDTPDGFYLSYLASVRADVDLSSVAYWKEEDLDEFLDHLEDEVTLELFEKGKGEL